MSVKSAGIGRMEITHYISNKHIDMQTLYHTNWANPYDPWQGLKMNFYYPKNVQSLLINDPCEFNSTNQPIQNNSLLIIRKRDEENPCLQNLIKQNNFNYIHTSIPNWIIQFNSYYEGFDDKEVLLMYTK